MRVRWGRVGTAVVAAPAGTWVVGMAALWATAPAPIPGTRSTLDATGACAAAELLRVGPSVGPEGAGAVVSGAAWCATLGDVPAEELFDVYRSVRAAIPTYRAERPPAEALDGLLDLWELAADEQRNGSIVHLAVWTAVGQEVAPEVGRALADPALPHDARAAAAARLRALARRDVAWDQLHRFEERSTWETLGRMAADPAWWPELVFAPRLVWVARAGTHPILGEVREDLITLRAYAHLLEALAGG